MVSFCAHLAGVRRIVARRLELKRAGRRVGGLALLLCAASASAALEEAWLERWFTTQTNVRTWSASFTQTRSLKVLAQPLVTTGRVWVALPDRFRWELGEPAQTIALRQPDLLWVMYPRLKRAEKYPLDAQQPGPWRDALALLEAGFPRSRAELESRFRVLSVAQTNATLQLTLQPRSAAVRRMMTEIRVSLRTNDFSLLANEVNFVDGSSLRNEYRNATLNATLPEGRFEATLGEGMTVVEPLRR
jgi:outer membrane lipoprotein-sorting protein